MKRLLLALALAAGCTTNDTIGPPSGGSVPRPENLRYTVTPGGPGNAPVATLLEWDASTDPAIQLWNIYSRTTSSQSFGLRATTTSATFHDRGVPELEYYVTAVDAGGFESEPSASVIVDERLTLSAPADLSTTSLDGAIALFWDDNAFEEEPDGFANYRVYSAPYDLDRDRCGEWTIEGTTVAPEFVSGALENGVPRCFGVSAISIEGFESLWSPVRDDTPRPESRNLVVYAAPVDPVRSSFRFWRDVNGDRLVQRTELGLVGAAAAPDADLVIQRDVADRLVITPVRAAASMRAYRTAPIADLTAIDFAPASGYARTGLVAEPGWGYVFELDEGDGFPRYGAIRTTHVGRDFLILDWSYQTDPGNPQLLR
jgi:hypothetical protein